jgi:hypothetical protein
LGKKSVSVQYCSRSSERCWLPHAGGAFVKFDLSDDRRYCCDLLNLSTDGVCFGMDDEQLTLSPGARIEDAIVQVGDIELRGVLVIAHITQALSTGTICGAAFSPATKSDARNLTTLSSQLGKKRSE